MIIEQTVKIPDDYRIFLEVPRSVPSGIIAQVIIDIPTVIEDNIEDKKTSIQPPSEIENIRQLLKKEMAEKGTSGLMAASGDGWEAYVRDRHAKP